MNYQTPKINEAKVLLLKLKEIERQQDALREKEGAIRIALQAIYNKQTRIREVLDK